MCTFCCLGSIFNKMKFITAVFISIFLMFNSYAVAESDKFFDYDRGLFDIFSGKKIEPGAEKINKMAKPKIVKPKKVNTSSDKFFDYDRGLFDIFSGKKKEPDATKTNQTKRNTNSDKSFFYKDETPQNISFYTGTFDTIDKEGDDKTSLLGIAHKNKDLFRNTWLGRFSPTTGGFVTKKSSIYLYTGVEADYNLGPINISPSFAPGYYEAGNGKKLGSVLEFKSEVKIGVDLFKDTNLGYSYSHISNNDWGDTNPGSDSQSITFSKNF